MDSSEEVGLERIFKYCRNVNLEEEKYKLDNALLEVAVKNVLDDIEKYEGNVLFIVNCTRMKAWSNSDNKYRDDKNDDNKNNKSCNNDEYVPAGYAYCDSSFVRFKYFLAELEKKLKEKNLSYPIYWIILSAKYGFIEQIILYTTIM